jgi:hypothetical protein
MTSVLPARTREVADRVGRASSEAPCPFVLRTKTARILGACTGSPRARAERPRLNESCRGRMARASGQVPHGTLD